MPLCNQSNGVRFITIFAFALFPCVFDSPSKSPAPTQRNNEHFIAIDERTHNKIKCNILFILSQSLCYKLLLLGKCEHNTIHSVVAIAFNLVNEVRCSYN